MESFHIWMNVVSVFFSLHIAHLLLDWPCCLSYRRGCFYLMNLYGSICCVNVVVFCKTKNFAFFSVGIESTSVVFWDFVISFGAYLDRYFYIYGIHSILCMLLTHFHKNYNNNNNNSNIKGKRHMVQTWWKRFTISMNLISNSIGGDAFIWLWTWKVSRRKIHDPYVSACNVRLFFGCLFAFVRIGVFLFNFISLSYALHPFFKAIDQTKSKLIHRITSSLFFRRIFYVTKRHIFLCSHIVFFFRASVLPVSRRLICANSIRFQFGLFSPILTAQTRHSTYFKSIRKSDSNCNHLYLY